MYSLYIIIKVFDRLYDPILTVVFIYSGSGYIAKNRLYILRVKNLYNDFIIQQTSFKEGKKLFLHKFTEAVSMNITIIQRKATLQTYSIIINIYDSLE
jgi:hypothetical protein